MARERFRRIVEFPDYEVSDMGRVRRFESKKELKPWDDHKGYLRVTLKGKNKRLHILVAEAFIPNPDNLPVVNHIKGKKHDCRASQLEWCTQKENVQHAIRTGLRKTKRYSKET